MRLGRKGTPTVVLALALLVLLPAAAGAAGQIAAMSTAADAVVWQPQSSAYDRLILTVSGPGGIVRQEFKPGDTPYFSIYDAAGYSMPDGNYTWELQLVPHVDAAARAELAAGRASGDSSVGDRLRAAGVLPEDTVQSGYFNIAGGALVGDADEPHSAAAGGMQHAAEGAMTPLPANTVFTDDVIIQNSLCVGIDCVNGESFGFDTIRLKENNTRIKFQDTSVGSFPTQDWQLTANDSTNGGADRFSIDAVTGPNTSTPFNIKAGGSSANNALYVNSNGDIGMGTSTPVLELHIVDGDSPAVRLEQNGSSGFTPQTWDMAGNETNFFVRDVTNGSRLPFKIRPSAPTDSLFVNSNGDIGVGTASPLGGSNEKGIHVLKTGSTDEVLLKLESAGPTTRFSLKNQNAPAGAASWSIGHRQNGRFAVILDGSGGADEFSIDTNGDILVNGAVVHTSSRATKKDIVPVDPAQVLSQVLALPVAEWTYNKTNSGGRHLGPMAEDFYQQFGLGNDDAHIAVNDTAGVALAAIQGLNQVVEKKQQEIDTLKAQNDELTERLNALETLVRSLQ